MATDDEEVYLEAVASLDRIGQDGELPGDRRIVRNVLEAFVTRLRMREATTSLALVKAMAITGEAAQLSGLIRIAKVTAHLQQELENVLSEQQQRITALGQPE
jgi:hypothetical protein